MDSIRIIVLCVAVALVCALLRQNRPEFAGMLSLAAGLGVLILSADSFREITAAVKRFFHNVPIHSEYSVVVLKAAGISIISELGVQICCDAGESALAGRIKLVCRIAMLLLALPGLTGILDAIALIAA